MFTTIRAEGFTQVTRVITDGPQLAFVFLIGVAGQIGRCSLLILKDGPQGLFVQIVIVLSDYIFTAIAASLESIACIVTDDDESAFELKRRWNESDLARKRAGLPSLKAVNRVLEGLDVPSVANILTVDFLDGDEFDWQ